jgi:hypothetical protein|uniref:Uncharacterized protein n=2 Tax=Arabidopsis thaliana TaxID=3702 RepID=Q1G3H0_ARATH|nr:unknown protein [Arabidopsis thaliana]
MPAEDRSLKSGGLKSYRFVVTNEDRESPTKETGFHHQNHPSDAPTHNRSPGKLVAPTRHIDEIGS